jgi:VanZ family protein
MSLLSRLVLDPALQRLRLYAALILYAAIIVAGSIPGARAEVGTYASGVVLHSLAYGILAFLVYTGIGGSAGSRALRSVLAVAAMGAGDELVQSLLPYRRGAVGDWLVDCTAAATVAALLWAFLPRRPGSSAATA